MRGKMTSAVMGMAVLIAGAALPTGAIPQEVPAQPPAEVDIASRFEEAVPGLFKEWLAVRPEVLRAIGLGTLDQGEAQCAPNYWYEFISCADVREPKLAGIDVRKTDSILTPFLGVIQVETSERCTVKRLVPGGMSWSLKKVQAIESSCLSKTYDECLKSGAKPAPKTMGVVCTGGPESTFSYSGDLTLSYRWSKGKWEFEGEEAKEPRQMPASKT